MIYVLTPKQNDFTRVVILIFFKKSQPLGSEYIYMF